MNDTINLAQYTEGIEQHIRDIRVGQSALPRVLNKNIRVPTLFSGTSNGIEDVIAYAPLYM